MNSETGVPWSFEPLPGFADPNQEYMAMSDNTDSWPETWPNRESDWDGIWNGAYGKYTRADQESYYVIDDYYNDEFAYFPDSTDADQIDRRAGLGVKLDGDWVVIGGYWR